MIKKILHKIGLDNDNLTMIQYLCKLDFKSQI